MSRKTRDVGGGSEKETAAAGEGPTFEERLKALERVVARLENDEVPLEEAITLYEEGMKLHRSCEKILAEAQLRIEKLTRPGQDETAS